jgi:hypothetical protein
MHEICNACYDRRGNLINLYSILLFGRDKSWIRTDSKYQDNRAVISSIASVITRAEDDLPCDHWRHTLVAIGQTKKW